MGHCGDKNRSDTGLSESEGALDERAVSLQPASQAEQELFYAYQTLGTQDMNTRDAASTAPTPGLPFLLPIAITLALTRVMYAVPQEPGGSELLMLMYAAAACLSALFFVPLSHPSPARGLLLLLRNCALITTIFALAILVDTRVRTTFSELIPLVMMLYLLLMAALAPMFVVETRAVRIRPIAITVFAVLIATPVWLGPLAEQAGNPPTLTNFIVGVSPLSALAVSIDADYLRTTWFYSNSPLGSLRYEYVSWTTYVLAMLAIISVLLFGTLKSAYNHTINTSGKRVALL